MSAKKIHEHQHEMSRRATSAPHPHAHMRNRSAAAMTACGQQPAARRWAAASAQPPGASRHTREGMRHRSRQRRSSSAEIRPKIRGRVVADRPIRTPPSARRRRRPDRTDGYSGSPAGPCGADIARGGDRREKQPFAACHSAPKLRSRDRRRGAVDRVREPVRAALRNGSMPLLIG